MGLQTEGVTQLAGASSCAEASQKALACAAAHGENKATACDALFKTYKACRKAEHVEVVRHRRENKKGLFWD